MKLTISVNEHASIHRNMNMKIGANTTIKCR